MGCLSWAEVTARTRHGNSYSDVQIFLITMKNGEGGVIGTKAALFAMLKGL